MIVPPDCSFQAQTRFKNSYAPKLAAPRLLPLHKLPLDKALGRDAGVIRPRLPEHVASAHPLETGQDVLQRVVERVPHMQRSRHVRRRDHDGKRLCLWIFLERSPRAEGFRLLPLFEDSRFDIGVIVSFFQHLSSLRLEGRC